MMVISFETIALVTSALLVAAPVLGQTCVDDLTQIFDAEKGITGVSETRTYILCTDTTFTTGSVIEEGASSDQFPILPRSNMRVLCGESGSSDGNCVITGVSGILSATVLQGGDNFFPSDNNIATNFYVSGVTFTNLMSAIIFNDGVEGEWTFNDIIVRDNVAVRHITLKSIFPAGDPRLFASTRVRFVNSQFLRNRNLPVAGEAENGFGDPAYNFLMYVPEPSTELFVENCVFDENDYSNPIAVDAIVEANPGWPRVSSLYYGASLQRWRNNCFYDNFASRRALIDSRFATPEDQIEFTITNDGNYVLPGGGNQAELRCPFIRQSFLVFEGNETSVMNECINSTSELCLADVGAPVPSSSVGQTPAPTTPYPTLSPTHFPTRVPTPLPSASPSIPTFDDTPTTPVPTTPAPTLLPTHFPTPLPSVAPTIPTDQDTPNPTLFATPLPSASPTMLGGDGTPDVLVRTPSPSTSETPSTNPLVTISPTLEPVDFGRSSSSESLPVRELVLTAAIALPILLLICILGSLFVLYKRGRSLPSTNNQDTHLTPLVSGTPVAAEETIVASAVVVPSARNLSYSDDNRGTTSEADRAQAEHGVVGASPGLALASVTAPPEVPTYRQSKLVDESQNTPSLVPPSRPPVVDYHSPTMKAKKAAHATPSLSIASVTGPPSVPHSPDRTNGKGWYEGKA